MGSEDTSGDYHPGHARFLVKLLVKRHALLTPGRPFVRSSIGAHSQLGRKLTKRTPTRQGR